MENNADGTLYTVKTEEEATFQGTCVDLEPSAILSSVHGLILKACDKGVPALVMGRDAECTAYIRLLRESLEDTDFTVYSMMSYNTA